MTQEDIQEVTCGQPGIGRTDIEIHKEDVEVTVEARCEACGFGQDDTKKASFEYIKGANLTNPYSEAGNRFSATLEATRVAQSILTKLHDSYRSTRDNPPGCKLNFALRK